MSGRTVLTRKTRLSPASGIGTALALTALAAGCQPAPPPFTQAWATAIEDSVAAELDRFRQTSASGDREALGRFYSDAPEFRFYESGQLRYPTADAVRAALAGLPPGAVIDTRYQDTRILALSPGLAQVSTLFESTFSDGADMQFSFGGALTLVWVHEADGWKILTGHSSAPVSRGG